MKKYSAEFFKKKFEILFNKLLVKQGFTDEIKEVRKELGIPLENGFINSLELAEFLSKKLTKVEKETVFMFGFIDRFEAENHTRVSEKDRDAFFKYFMKNRKGKDASMINITFIQGIIENHNNLFTSNKLLQETTFFLKLSPIVFKIFNKYWGFDLLDEQIAVNLLEKYLFLGDGGVRQYIQAKVDCPSCRYIGIDHFSPDRHDMQGQDKGAFSKNYIFNKQAVKRLSSHFNSVFLLIKPYASKEQVLNYVEDNWNTLKEHMTEKNTFYRQFDVHPSKIKESDFDRNKLVYELYKLPKKELTKMYKGERGFLGTGIYKETIISAILKEERGIDMSPDAIKKASTRFAKSTRIKKQPKDIGDI